MPAHNERFGASGAVTRLKVTCEHERKYPAERLVSAAAAPSRYHVTCNGGTAQYDIQKKITSRKKSK